MVTRGQEEGADNQRGGINRVLVRKEGASYEGHGIQPVE